jgi:hydrogenase maturation protein HypF
VDLTGVLRRLAETRMKQAAVGKTEAASLALAFHQAVAAAALEGARLMRERTGIRSIALSGGVFQNVLLNELLRPALAEAGFDVYAHRAVPPGDGCIAVGQVYFLPGNR